MIICITGIFKVYERGRVKEERFMVSHGVDTNTGRNVILPNEHPSSLGAILDPEYGEWIIYDKPDNPYSNRSR